MNPLQIILVTPVAVILLHTHTHTYIYIYIYNYIYTRCLRKNCATLFLSELRQISTNFNNFWKVDEKMAEIICHVYIFHLPHLRHRTTLLNTKVLYFTVSQ